MRDLPLTYERADGFMRGGTVISVTQQLVVVRSPGLTPGDVVRAQRRDRSELLAEVTTADTFGARCTPLGSVDGLEVGASVRCDLARLGVYSGASLLGCMADAWGRVERVGRQERSPSVRVVPLDQSGVSLRSRAPICAMMRTGVPAIDMFATLGYGQRVSLTAGAGVGKSRLLQRIADHADVDARVVALVGERGREAAEMCERVRASPNARTTTVYFAPSDASAIERFAAARSASAHAERLCKSGRRVLLLVDSLTRVAAAWREMALAAGEPPAQRGHPASMASMLARLVERAGARRCGSVTGVYSVLVDGDDEFEPVTDALRALLDGHVSLARRYADAGRYPAIDVLRSLSRAMPDIVSARARADATLVRRALATLESAEDLFAIGAYRSGGDPWLDACVAVRSEIDCLIFDSDRACADPEKCLASVAAELRRAPGPLQAIA